MLRLCLVALLVIVLVANSEQDTDRPPDPEVVAVWRDVSELTADMYAARSKQSRERGGPDLRARQVYAKMARCVSRYDDVLRPRTLSVGHRKMAAYIR